MRIVLDTNVLARAAMPTSGLARELLARCLKEPHVLDHGVEVVGDVELMERLRGGSDEGSVDR